MEVPGRLKSAGDRRNTALDALARDITARLADRKPLVITVMNGGLIFAGQLLPRLAFPLAVSYVHVRRYGKETTGGSWSGSRARTSRSRAARSRPSAPGFSRTERMTPAMVQPDFAGVRVPDRFVFGFGMDVAGEWRNLPAIRALKDATA